MIHFEARLPRSPPRSTTSASGARWWREIDRDRCYRVTARAPTPSHAVIALVLVLISSTTSRSEFSVAAAPRDG